MTDIDRISTIAEHSGATGYSLAWHTIRPQKTDGKTWWEIEIAEGIGNLVYAVNVAGAALKIGTHDGIAMVDYVGVIAESIEDDGERTGWSLGWVELLADGTPVIYQGNYEDRERYVVETCHEGSAWCVRVASPEEMDDPEEDLYTHGEALTAAAATASELGCPWYDLTLYDSTEVS